SRFAPRQFRESHTQRDDSASRPPGLLAASAYEQSDFAAWLQEGISRPLDGLALYLRKGILHPCLPFQWAGRSCSDLMCRRLWALGLFHEYGMISWILAAL